MADVTLDIHIEAGDWHKTVSDLENFILRAFKATLSARETFDAPQVEISVLLTDDAHQQALNLEWRKMDTSTNVLSFPSGEESVPPGQALLLGDISLAFETVLQQSQSQSQSFQFHLSHLLVHGLLHLLGFDHESPIQADEMETLEIEILQSMGVDDPYADKVLKT